MKNMKIISKFLLLFFLFQNIELFAITPDLLADLNFLLSNLSNEQFFNPEKKMQALKLTYEIKKDYETLDAAILKRLVKLQKMACAKLEIVCAYNGDLLDKNELANIKLSLLGHFYSQIRSNLNYTINSESQKYDYVDFDNDFVTKSVQNYLTQIFSGGLSLLKLDLYGFWNELFEKYLKFISSYRSNKNDLTKLNANQLDDILKSFEEQKEILEKLYFNGTAKTLKNIKIWTTLSGPIEELEITRVGCNRPINLEGGYLTSNRCQVEEQLYLSLRLFDIFIFNLIKISDEISKICELKDKLNNKSLDTLKKGILLHHLIVLMENDNLSKNNLDGEFYSCFKAYDEMVNEHLFIKSLDENLFKYNLGLLITKLKNLKQQKSQISILPLLGFNSEENKKNALTKYLIDKMLEVLEMIQTGKNNGLAGEQGLIDKILGGKIPDSIKNFILSLI